MNKKLTILLLSFSFAVVSVYSQDWETVKSNDSYVYGEGWGVTVAEADKQALNDLISKISIHVIGDVHHEESEKVTNAGIEGNSTFSVSVKTYSQATLNNTHKVVIKNEPDAHVGRWIKVSEINKIFEGRKNKIKDYVSSAMNAQKQGKIDVALKDYYWALCLVKSLRYPNEMSYVTEEGEELLLITWIPRRIKEIFSDVKPIVTKSEGDEVELYITYKGNPVSSIDYTYFDGRDWSNIYSAKDGVGVVELAPGNQSDAFQLKFEYEFRGESQIDIDVENVLNTMPTTVMPEAYFSVKNKEKSRPKQKEVVNSFSEISPEIYSKPSELKDADRYYDMIEEVVEAISKKKYESVNYLFTEEGLDVYHRLIKYGNAKVVGYSKADVYKNGDNIIVRGLQMSFSFKNGMRKSFVEDVVFYIDKNGKIDNLTFGLGKTAENDILCKGVWPESARFAIMCFLENYKTAYALKRLDYISTIFDDDAVIIVGKVVHVSSKYSNNKTQNGNEIIKYNRYTKDSFLKHLERSFASKEYINIRFADNDVRKLGKGGEMYAIQISQEYYSSNYGDKGYLFLMVDINNPDEPIIKVRTWQPEKDPNFGIYGPEDFK